MTDNKVYCGLTGCSCIADGEAKLTTAIQPELANERQSWAKTLTYVWNELMETKQALLSGKPCTPGMAFNDYNDPRYPRQLRDLQAEVMQLWKLKSKLQKDAQMEAAASWQPPKA